MAKPSSKKKSLHPQAPPGAASYELAADDLAALEAFCAAVPLEEVGFQRWSASHHQLDLLLSLSLTPEEWAQGGEKTLEFARSVVELGPGQKILARYKEKLSLRVPWPPCSPPDFEFSAPGLGDVRGPDVGSVRVRLKVAVAHKGPSKPA